MKKGCPYGTHRVIEPKGVLPQPANVIDNTMEIYDNEVLIDVKTLNIDSASFTEIERRAGGDIEEILEVRPEIDQVDIKGQAILFQSGIYAKLPEDMEEGLALSALDVAGAPAQTAKLVKPGDTVVVIGGGGKSGLLCLYEAKKRAGVTGKVICVAGSPKSEARARNLDLADEYFSFDATDAVGMYDKIYELTNGELADIVINCVNIENTEMASILATKDDGLVYFFSMATSFTKAALGAEGVGKDVTMMVGNGYTKGHAEITLQCLREHEGLRKLFQEMYA